MTSPPLFFFLGKRAIVMAIFVKSFPPDGSISEPPPSPFLPPKKTSRVEENVLLPNSAFLLPSRASSIPLADGSLFRLFRTKRFFVKVSRRLLARPLSSPFFFPPWLVFVPPPRKLIRAFSRFVSVSPPDALFSEIKFSGIRGSFPLWLLPLSSQSCRGVSP